MPAPWLSIVGIGEDGLDGLSAAARELLGCAELVAGGHRHLALVASLGKPAFEWETPFAASIPKLLAHRGKRVVALCSGDPFWYGAGAVIAEAVATAETVVIPASSSFAWAAARLRWRLEETITLGGKQVACLVISPKDDSQEQWFLDSNTGRLLKLVNGKGGFTAERKP